MQQVELQIKNKTGLHTRPATIFIKKAKEFDAKITIAKAAEEADAKSIVKVLKLGISEGDTIIITTTGSDEKEALKGLVELLEHLQD